MRQMKKVVRHYRFARTVVKVVNPLPKPNKFIFIKASIPIPPPNKVLQAIETWDKVIKYTFQMSFYATALYKWQTSSDEFRDYVNKYFTKQEELIDAMRSAGDKDDEKDPEEDADDDDGKDPDEDADDDDGKGEGPHKSGQDATEVIKDTEDNKRLAAEKKVEVPEALNLLNSKLKVIGNLGHDSVPIHDDEGNNAVVRSWGEKRMEPQLKNHVELLGIADMKKGVDVAGGRGFYLKGAGVWLNQALIHFGLDLLEKRGYTALQTPFFMKKDIMAKCGQLAQFDELYKVTGEGDDKYLIATAEQLLCLYHEMIKNSEEFYQMLNLPYHVVPIISGALNDAAAKKYDLEGWFPASQTYRELVSCSNCTDYQSRNLAIRFGQKKSNEQTKQYVHLLNSTRTATERIICYILDNYQKEDGVEVPEVLRNFMGGVAFLPFKNKLAPEVKGKKSKT